jgi:hypothetical protein
MSGKTQGNYILEYEMKREPRFLALLEDGVALEFITDEGVICPSCDQDFLCCLATEPPGCSVLALTPEQLISGGYARPIQWEDLTERDRFVKDFTKQKSPECSHKESRLLLKLSDGRLFEFLDDSICPTCNQEFIRCLASLALGLPESSHCILLGLTPEQMLSAGYARIVAGEDVTEKDKFAADFSDLMERFKQGIVKLLKNRQK